jgi:hypothetical protein
MTDRDPLERLIGIVGMRKTDARSGSDHPPLADIRVRRAVKRSRWRLALTSFAKMAKSRIYAYSPLDSARAQEFGPVRAERYAAFRSR